MSPFNFVYQPYQIPQLDDLLNQKKACGLLLMADFFREQSFKSYLSDDGDLLINSTNAPWDAPSTLTPFTDRIMSPVRKMRKRKNVLTQSKRK